MKLYRGLESPEVEELQRRLGFKDPDGYYGALTEAAVKVMQRTLGLKTDGVVGDETWAQLLKLPPIPVLPEKEPEPIISPAEAGKLDVARITKIAGDSKIARYSWPGRGRAPSGYTKGVAVSFAVAVLAYRADYIPAISMARASPASSLDALSSYSGKYAAMDMSNDKAGEDVLRHLFMLVLGLGMRESSGRHCCGRDTSASNRSSDTCEAGAWQQSWDSHAAVPLLTRLMNDYKGDGYANVYSEGVKCSKSDWRNWGTGTGNRYQVMCKEKPDFAAQACALGLRSLRTHWGPIVRREVTLRPEADDMFRQVQDTLK